METQENSASQKQSKSAWGEKGQSIVPNAAEMSRELSTDLSGKTAKFTSPFSTISYLWGFRSE